MSRNPRRFTGVCRLTQQLYCMWTCGWGVPGVRLITHMEPSWCVPGQYICCIYLSSPGVTAYTREFRSWKTALHNICTPISAPGRLWVGRKEVVVLLRYDGCDPEGALAEDSPIFQLLGSGPESELWEGLCDSAARQRDTFLTRECHVFTHICYQVLGSRSDIETAQTKHKTRTVRFTSRDNYLSCS